MHAALRVQEEAHRWQSRLEDTLVQRDTLVGDSLLAAACVCYGSPFPTAARQSLVAAWRGGIATAGVPIREGADLRTVLGDPMVCRRWRSCGLTADALAEENAITLCGGADALGGRAGGGGSREPGGPRPSGSGISPLTPLWPLIIDPQGQALRLVECACTKLTYSVP